MSQDWFPDVYQLHLKGVDTIMTQIELMLDTLKSGFSGDALPSDMVGGMVWHRSTARKVRNYANTAWLVSLLGDANQKMWVYRNDACEGWLIDASITDRVLAIKGGANDYDVNGGVQAGSWTQPDHTLTEVEIPSHNHSCASNGSHSHSLTTTEEYSDGDPGWGGAGHGSASKNTSTNGSHSHSIGSTGGEGAHHHGDTYRPAAAVGTLQYPDLS